MTLHELEEQADAVEHPPFRLRARRRMLLPDFTPPTRAELRWAAAQRRARRAEVADRRGRPRVEATAPNAMEAPTVIEQRPADPTPIEPIESLDLISPIEWPELEPFELAEPEPEPAPVPVQVAEPEPVVLRPVVLRPAVLDAIETPDEEEPPRFARLRSPQVIAPRPPWLDRGPLFDDPEDGELPDFEPDLDLDFHLAVAAVVPPVEVVEEAEPALADEEPVGEEPAHEEPAYEEPAHEEPALDEPTAEEPEWLDVWADAKPLLATLTLPPDIEERFEPAPAVPKVWDGRPAPMYWRVLRLRHIRPNGWLRALFFEGSVVLAVVLVLAEAASVWTIVVLPFVVAVIVKANDVVVGSLRRSFSTPERSASERAD